MDKLHTATFIGHRKCFGISEDTVRQEIIKLTEKGVTTFLNGGMGGFDWLCAALVYELKKSGRQIENFLVIPYLTFKPNTTIYFDDVLYPEGLEYYHFKAAIPARNKYMIDNSAFALCYVEYDWGGAFKTYQRALKKGLNVVNIASYSFEKQRMTGDTEL